MRFLFVALFPLAVACSTSTETEEPLLRVQTTAQLYVVCDTIAVITANMGDTTLNLRFCDAEIERQQGNSFVARSALHPGTVCISGTSRLAAGDSTTGLIVLAPDAPVGVFRFIIPS